MVTNLQVNANTSSAVSAFNALMAAINGAHTAFQRFAAATGSAVATFNNYSNLITAFNSAFARLSSIFNTLLNVLSRVVAGIGLVFSSMLRELDKIQGFQAVMTVTANSADAASQAYNFLRQTADRLGVQFDALSSNYAKLVAALPPGTNALRVAERVFLGVASAARTLYATNQDTQLMFYAVTQIASKGIVSMEELRRQLGEKLPGAIQIAANALNTTPDLLEAAIRKGIVSAEKFLPIFGDALIRTFADSSERAAQSVSASINRLTNVWVDFVKQILDSGAGNSIVNVFDALRERLSDPYLIERFAQLVKYVADNITDFVSKLTREDLRNGFDQFQRAMEFSVRLLGKLIDMLTWIINNAGKAGAILGGVAGLSVGALAGPVGAAVGAATGASLGAYAGSSLSSTAGEKAVRAQQDAAALASTAARNKELELFKLTELLPTLGKFTALQNFNGLERLFEAQNLNTKTIADLNRILASPEYKTSASKVAALREYARYGAVLSPQDATLQSVLTSNTKGNAREARQLDSSFNQALGLSSTFSQDLERLNKLYRQGRLAFDEYQDGLERLIAKQPYMIEYQRSLRDELSGLNKATSEHISFVIGRIDLDESVTRQLEDQHRLAGLRANDLQIETELQGIVNQYVQRGYEVKESQLAQWREEIRLKNELKALTTAEDSVLNETVDRYKPAILRRQAMQRLIKNPNSGFTLQDAQDLTVNSDERFKGSEQWIEAQQRALQDYYAFIDGLRREDLIREETAQRAKALAEIEMQQMRMQYAQTFFNNLVTLSNSNNKTLARIGKAAAITQATIDAYLAINKALATLPPPASYIVAASIGAAAFANVAKIAGFKKGGYTGDGPTDAIAGVTHGREFVVNASATSRNRAALERLNSGGSLGGTGVVVEVHNYGVSKSFEVEQVSEDRIRIIARDEVARTGLRQIAAAISDANSDVSQSLSRNFDVTRRR